MAHQPKYIQPQQVDTQWCKAHTWEPCAHANQYCHVMNMIHYDNPNFSVQNLWYVNEAAEHAGLHGNTAVVDAFLNVNEVIMGRAPYMIHAYLLIGAIRNQNEQYRVGVAKAVLRKYNFDTNEYIRDTVMDVLSQRRNSEWIARAYQIFPHKNFDTISA